MANDQKPSIFRRIRNFFRGAAPAKPSGYIPENVKVERTHKTKSILDRISRSKYMPHNGEQEKARRIAQRGYTLLELVCCIAVICALCCVGLFYYAIVHFAVKFW